MIEDNSLRYNIHNKKFVVFDYEGDLNLFFSTPFQLGMAVYHGTKLVSEHDFYIKWDNLYISDFVKKYAHYSAARMKSDGKNPIEVFTFLNQFLTDPQYLLVGANILSYDCPLTYNCLKRLGLPHSYDFLNKCYDVNALFKGYKLGLKPDNNNLLAYQLSMNSWKQRGLKSNVGYVAKEFKIECDEDKLHDGVYDVKIIAQNFLELIKKINIT